MPTSTYQARREQLTTYFDKTAADAWARLTSTAPVGRVRATVRAGRDAMRETLLGWLPEDLSGRRVLDAGCGTGAFAVEAARRGADVVAIDVAAKLVAIAAERAPLHELSGSIRFLTGDMLDSSHGEFDHVIAMDSLIHYRPADFVESVMQLSRRTTRSVLVTFAPRTALLSAMHVVGRIIPHREHRAPAIVPLSESHLGRELDAAYEGTGWRRGRTRRVDSGFYISQGLELVRR